MHVIVISLYTCACRYDSHHNKSVISALLTELQSSYKEEEPVIKGIIMHWSIVHPMTIMKKKKLLKEHTPIEEEIL